MRTKVTWAVVSSLFLVSIIPAVSAVPIGEHDITFISHTYDLITGTSTWTYQVTSGSSPSISNWVMAWCLPEAIVNTSDPEHTYYVDPDPSSGLTGIKFNRGYQDGEVRTVWFKLSGDYPEGNVTVAIKAGSDVDYGTVTGPLCVPEVADVAIEKTGVEYAHEEDTIPYSFTVTNYGPDAALNVHAVDDLLGEITLSNLTDEDGDGFFDDLAAGANATGTASYTVPTPSDDITNTVTVTSTTPDPDPTNNQDSWTVVVLRPKNLDAEPPRLIDLTQPLSTQWLELYPNYNRSYRLESWVDINRNGILDPSDFVDLWDKDLQKKVYPYWWHIDDITVTMKVSKKPYLNESMYIEFEGGWTDYNTVIVHPESTQWYEVYPIYGNQYHLEQWFDNCDNILSPSDQIILRDKATGEDAEYHVDEVKTDLIISPRTTQIILGKTKDYLGQGYPQIIPVTIDNYYAKTTVFTVTAYYDGLQPIGNQTITLNPLESREAIVAWTETATWPKGTHNHTITINTYANNTLVYTTTFPIAFKITIIGDVNGDSKVDIRDIASAAISFGSYRSHPRYNPSADINCDGKIDIKDIATVAKNFGKIDP